MESYRNFLNKWETLAQAILAPCVLGSVLCVVKIALFTASLVISLSSLRVAAQDMCYDANEVLNNSALFPEKLEAALMSLVLVLMEYVVTLVKQFCGLVISVGVALIDFLVEIYLGTLTCLSTALIRGLVESLADVLRLVTETIDKAVNGVLKEFNSAMNGLSKVLNSVILGVDAIKTLFGGSQSSTGTYQSTLTAVNLTVSSLKNISVPTAYIDKIEKLADDIPSFEDVLSNVTSLLTLPLQLLAQEIELANPLSLERTNFTSVKGFSVNSSSLNGSQLNYSLPINSLLPFCENMDHSFQLATKKAQYATKIIDIVLAFGVIAILTINLIFVYRKEVKRITLLEDLAIQRDPIGIGNRIQEYDIGLLRKVKIFSAPRKRWFFSFIFSSNLRFCLGIGYMGLVTVSLQYSILRIVRRQIMLLLDSNSNLGTADLLNSLMSNLAQSVQSNIALLIQSTNNVLFSSVKTTSSDILSSMMTFQNRANDTISSVFKGTPFANPMKAIVYCTIGRKIEDIEQGLAWIVNKLNIPTPSVQSDLQDALIKSSSNGNLTELSVITSSLAQKVLKRYQVAESGLISVLKKELIISCIFLGIWLLYFVSGVVIVTLRRDTGENRVNEKDISWPQRFESTRKSEYPYLDSLPHSSSSLFYGWK